MNRQYLSGRLLSTFLALALLLATGAAVALLLIQPAYSVAATVNFIDSGQSLGGNVESAAVALGDLDGDGDRDAVVANFGGASRVYVNLGGDQGGSAGQFQDSGQTLGSGSAVDVALGDLDGDTDLDAFIVLDSFGDSNQVWINQGVASGTFSQTGQVFGDQLSTSVHLAQLDDNATLDAFVGRGFGQPSKVWFNDGAGQFTDSGQSLDSASNDVDLADFDGDGDVDAYSANAGASKVWINQGGDQGGTTGIFLEGGQLLGTALSMAGAAGDLDGNAGPDIYDANSITDRVWLNDGAANFSAGSPGSAATSRDVALADVDGDGDLDAFVATGSANEVWVNQGGAQGGNPGDLNDSGLRLGNIFSEGLALADVDGDGDLDAFVANWGVPNRVWLNQRLAPNPSGFGWQVESVATRGNSGLRGSIALDQQGFPHVAFVEHQPVTSGNDDRLSYGYWDGVRWHFEVVDEAPHISDGDGYVSLALDAGGGAHIAYPAGTSVISMDLRYAHRSGDFWVLETIDAGKRTGRHVSMDLDGDDRPHVIYHDSDGLELIYTRWDGSDWSSEVVDASNVSDSDVFASLILDGDDRPHIAYVDGTTDRLLYAVRIAGVWQPTQVDDNLDGFSPYPDIAIGPNGQPAIAYVGDLGWELRYAAWDGAAWQVEVAYQALAGSVDERVGLAFDSQDNPHIVYGHAVSPNLFLEHTYWDGAAWSTERLDNSGRAGSDAATAMDNDGNLHATYYEDDFGDLRHVYWGPNWERRVVAAGTIHSPGMRMKDGQPGIGYYDLGAGLVRMAQWSDGWQIDPVGFTSMPATQVSHAAGFGKRHVSYYDADNQRLMYGRRDATGWTLQIVDESGDSGRHNDLLLPGRNDGRPRIAYWDAALMRIKVAALDDSVAPVIYTNTTGPALDASSGYPAIGALPGGILGVSYYDGANGDLRFAALDPDNGIWTDQVVDGILGANVGRLNDVQVDGTEGEPVVAYFDETNEAIKFAYRQGGAWHIETAIPSTGALSALALGLGLNSRTRARITYVTASGDVNLAILDNGDWSTRLVATGAQPEVKSISLDLNARPHLAIAHDSDGLVYAYRAATLDLEASPAQAAPTPTGGYYNPLDACLAVLNFFLDDDAPVTDVVAPSAPSGYLAGGDDLAVFSSLRRLFTTTAGGQRYINLYLQHGSEMGQLGLEDPVLLWDAFGTLQNFLPGLEALVTGRGDEVLVTQQMVDDALDIWQRLAAAGSPELAGAINTELAASNDLQDFAGLSFDQWALAIGVAPPRFRYLPVLAR